LGLAVRELEAVEVKVALALSEVAAFEGTQPQRAGTRNGGAGVQDGYVVTLVLVQVCQTTIVHAVMLELVETFQSTTVGANREILGTEQHVQTPIQLHDSEK
jgi:hypothetical protein